MIRTTARLVFLGIAIGLLSIACVSQVATGTPRFGSFAGESFDTVNLGNLNVHFAVPVFSRAGRGIPFSYVLSYDSSVWNMTSVGGSQTWTPVASWGWRGVTEVTTGYVSRQRGNITYCGTGKGRGQITTFINWVYHDTFGVSHPFNGTTEVAIGLCGNGSTGFTSTTTDGSGYTLTALGQDAVSVTASNGSAMTPPTGQTSGAGTITDANGNKITVNASGQFTDTLGTVALTATGSGTPTSPLVLTYTRPDNTPASVTVNYVQYTVKTNFGAANISEYPATSAPLVDNISLPDGTKYSFFYERTPSIPAPGACTPLSGTYSAYCVTGRIASVTLPTGGQIAYVYSDGSNGAFSDGSTATLTRTLIPGGLWKYVRNNTSGSHWQTTITSPPDPVNAGSAADVTVIDFQKDSATTNPTQNFYETQRQTYQENGTGATLLSTTATCYNNNVVAASCATTSVATPILRQTTFTGIPDFSSSGVQAETDSTYDNFGLINIVNEYDYGNGQVGSLIRKTVTTYGGLGNGIVDRPVTVAIKDANNIVKASTTYTYDEGTPTATSGTPQHVAVTGSRGLLTTVAAQANGTTTLYRKYTYYDTGLLKTSTDVSTSNTVNGATTTYNYSTGSCGNSFVTSISEPLSLSRSMTWDCNGGVMLSLTDENGKVSSTAYSGTNYTNYFWRPYSTTDQAGNTTNYFYYLNSSNQPFQTESKYVSTFNGGSSIVDTLTTTDGFGRTIFTQTKQGPSATNYDTIATCYDTFGRVGQTTLPYSAAAITSATTACPSGNPGKSFAYDALNRTKTITDSGGGSTNYTYAKNDVLEVHGSPTLQKQSEYDALGRLKSVCEVSTGTTAWPSASCGQNAGASGYLTTYAYDLLGNLTSVTQNAQAASQHQTRSFVYDMLGRLISETNPEMNNHAITYSYDSLSSDPACGTVTSADNLLKRLDASGNATCYTNYDALHRAGLVTYPSTSTPAKYFVYDAATVNGTSMSNAKTRLAEAYTCTGTCASKITDLGFSYAATGQASDVWEMTPHSGTNYYYHVSSQYWPNGAVNTIGNLAGLPTITYLTDGEGRTSTVSASSGQNPVTSVGYDAASHVTALTYGSADNDGFTFDPLTGRMSKYQFNVGTTPQIDKGLLTWNTNGSLQQLAITDQLNSANTQTCTYTHDDLGRIASANCGSSIWSQTFSFDPFGNINKAVPGGATGTSFQVSYDYTNNTNRITTAPYSYAGSNANNGNLTADFQHTYTWDTENKMTDIDSGTSNGVCVVYDALGRVVEQSKGSQCNVSPTSSTEIVYSPSGAKLALMNGSALVKAFVPLAGGAQAVYNASGLQYYRHPDWLGSSRLATTPSRTVYFDGAYAPYGENYAQIGTQDLSFTGQNQDTESSAPGGPGGLYDFLYRKHSPVQGRWLSPDPAGIAGANPSSPQSWNRYAYVGNQPLHATDALGLLIDPFGPGDGGGGGGGYCPPEYEFCGCDPFDPWCGDPFPGPIGPPDLPGGGGGYGPPRRPQRIGGRYPNGETLGLPAGLQTRPLGTGDLLGFLPGIDCGGMGGGSGFIGTTPAPSDPCPPDFSGALIVAGFMASGTDRPKAHDDTGSCTAQTGRGDDPLCNQLGNGWTSDSRFVCAGNGKPSEDKTTELGCCKGKAAVFSRWCDSRNYAKEMPDMAYSFKTAADDYLTQGRHLACCMKRKY